MKITYQVESLAHLVEIVTREAFTSLDSEVVKPAKLEVKKDGVYIVVPNTSIRLRLAKAVITV